MSRQAKEFIVQFPIISAGFRTSAPTAAEFKAAVDAGRGSRLMSVWMLADNLLTRAASHRETRNLFEMYSFASKRNLLSTEMEMAQKKHEQTTQDTNGRAEWKGFLDYRLDSYQLSQLDEWRPKPAEVWEMVENTIQNGYRFTLSYNKATKIATCTIIDDDKARKTAGHALASGDTDGASALKMAIFKQHILLQNDWTSLVDAPPVARRG